MRKGRQMFKFKSLKRQIEEIEKGEKGIDTVNLSRMSYNDFLCAAKKINKEINQLKAKTDKDTLENERLGNINTILKTLWERKKDEMKQDGNNIVIKGVNIW